jgi:hypothetical protein
LCVFPTVCPHDANQMVNGACIPWNILIAIGDLDSEVEGISMGFSRLFCLNSPRVLGRHVAHHLYLLTEEEFPLNSQRKYVDVIALTIPIFLWTNKVNYNSTLSFKNWQESWSLWRGGEIYFFKQPFGGVEYLGVRTVSRTDVI